MRDAGKSVLCGVQALGCGPCQLTKYHTGRHLCSHYAADGVELHDEHDKNCRCAMCLARNEYGYLHDIEVRRGEINHGEVGPTTITWIDTTNIAGWQTQEELEEFAKDGGWVCRNTGWVSYEDSECVVLSARRSGSGHWGLSERIPKSSIKSREL